MNQFQKQELNNCIFITFDNNYFDYAKVCLNSLKNNYPNHPQIVIYYKGNDSNVISYLENFDKVEILSLNHFKVSFDNLSLGIMGSSTVYNRFLLWDDYFKKYDTIIYLDCDTVILKPFPELFLKSSPFAVSDNSKIPVFDIDKDIPLKLINKLKNDNIDLNEIDKYMINSGVLVIPKKFRSASTREQIWKLINGYHKYSYIADQSILSIWMYLNDFEIGIDYRYNFQLHFISRLNIKSVDVNSITILHYALWKPNKNFRLLRERLSQATQLLDTAEACFKQYSNE